MKKLFFLSLLIPFFSCAEEDPLRCLDSEFGENFAIRISETAILCEEDVQITFTDVTNDSRCPSDVTCIWAGFVQVKLSISITGQEFPVELSTEEQVTGFSSSFEFDDKILQLVDVTPYPSTSAKFDGSKREVILRLEKVPA